MQKFHQNSSTTTLLCLHLFVDNDVEDSSGSSGSIPGSLWLINQPRLFFQTLTDPFGTPCGPAKLPFNEYQTVWNTNFHTGRVGVGHNFRGRTGSPTRPRLPLKLDISSRPDHQSRVKVGRVEGQTRVRRGRTRTSATLLRRLLLHSHRQTFKIEVRLLTSAK